ncbi:acyltransferase family protein [Streptococcus pneumoniae]|nr:acyltransferase family protein [Streptococcus pneumoniae]
MFYTYLRGLVVLLLWSINGNAHYHNTDKIPNQDENYIIDALSSCFQVVAATQTMSRGAQH